MFRSVENDLIEWKDHPNRKPLLIRGARQVGKSFVVKKIGTTHFEKQLTIGIRLSPHNLSFHAGILSLPFYMIHELPRILTQL